MQNETFLLAKAAAEFLVEAKLVLSFSFPDVLVEMILEYAELECPSCHEPFHSWPSIARPLTFENEKTFDTLFCRSECIPEKASWHPYPWETDQMGGYLEWEKPLYETASVFHYVLVDYCAFVKRILSTHDTIKEAVQAFQKLYLEKVQEGSAKVLRGNLLMFRSIMFSTGLEYVTKNHVRHKIVVQKKRIFLED